MSRTTLAVLLLLAASACNDCNAPPEERVPAGEGEGEGGEGEGGEGEGAEGKGAEGEGAEGEGAEGEGEGAEGEGAVGEGEGEGTAAVNHAPRAWSTTIVIESGLHYDGIVLTGSDADGDVVTAA